MMENITKLNVKLIGLFLIAGMLFGTVVVNGQHGWTVNPADYEFNGDVKAVVVLEGTDMTSGSVGAFVGDECRGVVDGPAYSVISERYVFSIFCYSNAASGETLTFKYYNDVDGVVYGIAETVAFQANMREGDLENPLVFQASVIDVTAPVVTTCPVNIAVSNDAGACGAVVNYAAPVFEDDVDGTGLSGTLTDGLASGAIFPVGVTTVTYAYTDAAGNGPAVCSFTVTVTDDEAPTAVGCPSNIAVVNDRGEDGAVVDYTAPLFADNCDGGGLTGALTAGLVSGVQFPMGETTVTYTYSDAAGNGPAVCTFTVTVNKGNYAPEVVAPIGSVSRSEGFGTATIDLTPVFSDPDEDVMTYSAVSGNMDVVTVAVDGNVLTLTEVAPGTSEIIVTANDGSLEAEDRFEVTVIYVNKAPVALGTIPDQVMVDNVDSALIDLKPLFEDPEGEVLTYTITMSEQGVVFYMLDSTMLRLDPYKPGSTVVTVTASDPEGATAEISFGAQVKQEYLLIVNYDSWRIQDEDTITLCNNADHITIRVNSKIKWDYSATNFWMVVELNADSSLNVGYSDNLTGADRMGVIHVYDVQGHSVEFYIRQSEDCQTGTADAMLPGVSLYPNPAGDRLFIDTGGRFADGSRLEIIDYRGQLLYSDVMESAGSFGGGPFEIDLQGYTAGVYFIRLCDENGCSTGKFVKQ